MARSTRREFVKQAAATASLPILSSSILADAQTPKVRYNVLSPEGQALVRKYAEGVRLMKNKVDLA